MRRMLLNFVVILALCPAFLTAGMLLAQPGGGQRGPLGGAFSGSLLMLATRPDVQQELQLIDEQRDKLDEVVTDARQRIGDEVQAMFSQTGNLSFEERMVRFEEIRPRIEKLNKEAEDDLKKALLPHQFDRLKQISVQQRIQQQGANALTSGDLAETLDLSDDQREKLEQRAAEVQQELQEKIAKLRLEARDKMLEVLTPEQRAKLQSLMGDAFAMQDGGFGPGGFQARGGRGGFFGGGQQRGDRGRDDNQRRNNGTN